MANASCSNCTLVSNLLTLVGSVSGTVLVGMTITGAGVPAGVTVTSYGTGSGQAGTYNCSASAANVSTGEAMVFSLSWDMPLQGNSSFPQLVDLGRAAGFGFIIASAIGGGTSGPGAEYQHGTHAVALYNAQAQTGTHVFAALSGKQGTSVKPAIITQPQYPEPRPSTIFDTSDLEVIAKYQPLRLVNASPQQYDPTPTMQPFLDFTGSSQSALGFGAEYQFGTHQKALYDSQNSSIIWNAQAKPPVQGGQVPLRSFHVQGQELNYDLTLQGWTRTVPVAQGFLVTMVTAGPQFADLTLEAVVTPSQPFHSAAPNAPINPAFFFAQPQFDTTQIPARVIKPQALAAKNPNQPFIIGGPTPSEQLNLQQIQPQLTLTALPGPAKYVQPAFVWAFEQQYDKTWQPQLITQPTIYVPPPPFTGFRVMAVTAGYYLGVYRTAGDVFDIIQASDFSDSTVDYQINSNNVGYGWMARVPPGTPLVNWLDSNNAPYLPPQDPLRKFIT